MRKSTFIGSSSSGSGGAPTGAAGGDLGGTYPNPTAVGLHWAQTALTSASSPYTVLATDTELNCNATGGNITVNLPASSGGGKNYFVIKTDSSINTVTISRNATPGTDTIEGSSTVVLSSQFDSLYLTDASTGSWLKISPKTPGSSGNIFFNSAGAFGAIAGSTADNITDISTAGGFGSSNPILLNRTWTNTGGSGLNTGHVIDTTATFNGTASVNTISHYYGRLTYQNNGGCQHCLGVLSRSQDQGTGGTVTDWQGYYADFADTGNPTTTITKYTGYYNMAGALNGTGTRTIADLGGFRNDLMALGASSTTTISKEIGFQTQVRASLPSGGTITKSFGIDAGNCSPGNVYLAAVFCGGRTDFLAPVLQTMTMGATSTLPLTASQLYGHFDNNFLSDTTVVYNYKSVLSHGNGGTGTSTVFYGKNDNGGTATAAKQTVFEAQLASSGAPNTATKQIAFSVLAPANSAATITDISGVEIASLASGTNTNQPQAIKQIGTSDINTYAGVSYFNGNRAFVTSDFTTSGSGTALEAITGLTFTLATNNAQNISFNCHFRYSQAVGTAAVAFGIKASVSPTQINASGEIYTSTTALTAGNLSALTTTIATAIMSGTPSVITTVWNANMRGLIENPSGAASTITFLVSTATAADLVTVKRGSYCTLGA